VGVDIVGKHSKPYARPGGFQRIKNKEMEDKGERKIRKGRMQTHIFHPLCLRLK
jgi:hypothetical protein